MPHPPSASLRRDKVQILIEGLQHLIPQAPVLALESGLPVELEIVSGTIGIARAELLRAVCERNVWGLATG